MNNKAQYVPDKEHLISLSEGFNLQDLASFKRRFMLVYRIFRITWGRKKLISEFCNDFPHLRGIYSMKDLIKMYLFASPEERYGRYRFNTNIRSEYKRGRIKCLSNSTIVPYTKPFSHETPDF